MNKKISIAVCSVLLGALIAVGMTACDKTDTPADTDIPTVTETEPATEPTTEVTTVEEETTEEATTEEETTLSLKDQIGLDVKDEDLKEIMQNIFSGTQSLRETVMFLDKGDVKELLYPISSVISVTSYDGKIVYEEGKDYVVADGKLKVTADSAIRCITADKYYNSPSSIIKTKNPATGQMVPTYWGESMIKQWQVSVTYTHDTAWEGFVQESQLEVYQNLVKKLVAGEDVTVFFYGDSITWGACASFHENAAPKQGSYAMLFTEALADLFGYTVKYINTGIVGSVNNSGMPCASVPATDYVGGERGTITYVNTAIGGWTSTDGINNFDKHVKAPFETYGCDLFVLAYGMNDGGITARRNAANMKDMASKMYELNPDAAVMFVATMTPHMGSNWDHVSIGQQEAELIKQAEKLREDGKVCAVACVNSLSKSIQEHKTFNDYSGNNINHPNDWFYRVYAQTLLQTLIGYENMN